jgi:membrane-bound lytic murein transglycosylase B
VGAQEKRLAPEENAEMLRSCCVPPLSSKCIVYTIFTIFMVMEALPGEARAGEARRAYDAREPSSWRLSAKLPKGSALRAALVKELGARPDGSAEKALSAEEAEALLDDPRAEMIYGEKTVSIVAPSMIARQRQDHLDLMKAFLVPERIAAGAAFARDRAAALERAAARHGVDPEVVVAILMWESKLGAITGEYLAFNSFASQAFFAQEANEVALTGKGKALELRLLDRKRQPERVAAIRERARKNLLVLVRSCKARGIDPLGIKGSWAGALGFPQFMPASLRWAEDGDGDGKIDLFTFEDSIASIARYLDEHGFGRNRQAAIWSYNHEDAYVKGVLAFADALRDARAKGEPGGADAGAQAAPGEGARPGERPELTPPPRLP